MVGIMLKTGAAAFVMMVFSAAAYEAGLITKSQGLLQVFLFMPAFIQGLKKITKIAEGISDDE